MMKVKIFKRQKNSEISNVFDLIKAINLLYYEVYKITKKIIKSDKIDKLEVQVLIARISSDIKDYKVHPIMQILNFALGILGGVSVVFLREAFSNGVDLWTLSIIVVFIMMGAIIVIYSYRRIHVRKIKLLVELKEYLTILKEY
ncbi:hypothetical protein [Peribacillus asahii]|uniref:hypothetical protein n=1 Tax=Peribacillus asahii TaxID=228899 RepID=UPI0037F9EE67